MRVKTYQALCRGKYVEAGKFTTNIGPIHKRNVSANYSLLDYCPDYFKPSRMIKYNIQALTVKLTVYHVRRSQTETPVDDCEQSEKYKMDYGVVALS